MIVCTAKKVSIEGVLSASTEPLLNGHVGLKACCPASAAPSLHGHVGLKVCFHLSAGSLLYGCVGLGLMQILLSCTLHKHGIPHCAEGTCRAPSSCCAWTCQCACNSTTGPPQTPETHTPGKALHAGKQLCTLGSTHTWHGAAHVFSLHSRVLSPGGRKESLYLREHAYLAWCCACVFAALPYFEPGRRKSLYLREHA
eukprot:scaffold89039_cov21-Tisochrysis_lutea.AAC.3